jgi:uncharacterized protein (UPF0262 family)
MTAARQRIVAIKLDEETVVSRTPELEHERDAALSDLLHDNVFAPVGNENGPYVLHLSIKEQRLVLDIRDQDDQLLNQLILSLTPFRRLVRDYFIVCESYYSATQRSNLAQWEAIDMGRRALHNEGAEVLRQRLEGKVEVDMDTGRRLFTLICVLHNQA